jgi:TonB-linked SusC/RagA family outer membrane protein
MKHHYLAKLLFLLLFACLGFSSGAYAQTGSVSGRVTDDKNDGVPGATILIEGTSLGSSSNVDGTFSIQNVPAGAQTLVISYVGYNTVRRPVTVVAGQNAEVSTSLTENATQLSEAVVIAYGTQTRRDMTGSVAVVNSAQLKNNSVASFDQALQGRAPGVQVTQSSGAVGSATRVRVRGQGSLTGGGDPLYVIDGVPISNGLTGQGDYSDRDFSTPLTATNQNALAAINPNDIESMTVLKDAAATAPYGARGANGVILVTTKRGKSGQTRINVDYYTGFSNATHKVKFIDGFQWWDLYKEAYRNDNQGRELPTGMRSINGQQVNVADLNAGINPNTNWVDAMLQQGTVHDANISASGGTDRLTFFVNGGYRKEEGILRGNSMDRYSGRLNVNNKISDRLSFGAEVSLNVTRQFNVATSYAGGFGTAQSNALPIFPIYNADGTYNGTERGNTGNNPVAQLTNKFNTDGIRTLTNLHGDFEIIKGLTLHSQVGLDFLNQLEQSFFSDINRYYDAPFDAVSMVDLPRRGLSSGRERRLNVLNWDITNTLTYTRDLNENNSLTLLAGTEAQKYKQDAIGAYATSGAVGFVNNYGTSYISGMGYAPGTPPTTAQNTAVGGFTEPTQQYRFISFFGRANYKFRNRYIAEISARADGSSRFGDNKRYGIFPAGSLAWIVSDEDFLRDNSVLNFLKLRGSYGLTGSSSIYPYQSRDYYGNYGNYLGTTGQSLSNLKNPDLSWQQTIQSDLSVEFGVFNNRLSGTLSVYQNQSSKILLDRPVPSSATGYITKVTINTEDVKVRDRGIELSLSSRNLTGAFTWTTDFNINHNSNVVTNAGGIPPDGFGASEGDTRVIQGEPTGISYLAKYAGVDPATGVELIYDLAGNKIPATTTSVPANRVAAGNPFPNYYGGITNTFTYKGVDVSFLFSFSQGAQIYDDGAKRQISGFINQWQQREEVLDRWQKAGDITDVPKATLASGAGDWNNTTRWLYDASYLRLRTGTIGYTLPGSFTQRFKVNSLRLFAQGQNLLLFTPYKGWDPEVTRYYNSNARTNQSNSQGNIAFSAPYLPNPQARTITFGVNMTL